MAELARIHNTAFISAFCSYRGFMSVVGGRMTTDSAQNRWYKHKSDLIPDECSCSCGISSSIAGAPKKDLLYCQAMA